jgi:hypothetical protein
VVVRRGDNRGHEAPTDREASREDADGAAQTVKLGASILITSLRYTVVVGDEDSAIASKEADPELYFGDSGVASIYESLIRRYGWPGVAEGRTLR